MIILTLKVTGEDPKYLDFFEKSFLFFSSRIVKDIKIIKIPNKIKKVTLLKSPHVFKKAKEHFSIQKHTRVIVCRVDNKSVFYYIKLLYLKSYHVSIKLKWKEETAFN